MRLRISVPLNESGLAAGLDIDHVGLVEVPGDPFQVAMSSPASRTSLPISRYVTR